MRSWPRLRVACGRVQVKRITPSAAGLALRYSEKLTPEQRKAAAVALAKARAASMTPERRKEIAAMGALARWGPPKE